MALPSYIGHEAATVVREAAAEIGAPISDDLVYQPVRLPTAVAEALATVSDRSRVEALAITALDGLPTVRQTTANRIVQADNQQELTNLVRASAIVRLMELALEATFESRTDAENLHALLYELIQGVKFETYDADLLEALNNFETAITAYIRDAVSQLPTIVSITPSEEVPSIVLSWQLYGSLDEADAIADRNRLPRPGFVPGRPVDIVR